MKISKLRFRCHRCHKIYKIIARKELQKKTGKYKCFLCGNYYYSTPGLPVIDSDSENNLIYRLEYIWNMYFTVHPDRYFISQIYGAINNAWSLSHSGSDMKDRDKHLFFLKWICNNYQYYESYDVLNYNYKSLPRR